MNRIHFSTHFYQNTADFFSFPDHIIWPLDLAVQTVKFVDCPCYCHTHHQSQHTCFFRSEIRTHQKCHGDCCTFRRLPDSSASSASGGLFIRDHQHSVRCSFFCHSFGTDIGGIKCIKISHFTARPVRVKSAFYFFRRNNIRTS